MSRNILLIMEKNESQEMLNDTTNIGKSLGICLVKEFWLLGDMKGF